MMWSIAQARKRFPIDASAKCSGTRSGVSMIRVSSDATAVDISVLLALDSSELAFSDLDQKSLCRAEIEVKVRLRTSFTLDVNTALLDQASSLGHRRCKRKFHQQTRQLPRSRW